MSNFNWYNYILDNVEFWHYNRLEDALREHDLNCLTTHLQHKFSSLNLSLAQLRQIIIEEYSLIPNRES